MALWYPCCRSSAWCPYCTGPRTWRVIVEDTGEFDGTYDVPFGLSYRFPLAPHDIVCEWVLALPAPILGFTHLRVWLTKVAFEVGYWVYHFMASFTPGEGRFWHQFCPPSDDVCDAVLGFVEISGLGGSLRIEPAL